MSLLSKFFDDSQKPSADPAPRVISEVFGESSRNVEAFAGSGQEVGKSRDLARVLELHRRSRPTDFTAIRSSFEHLKKSGPCDCRSKYNKPCASGLLDTQAWALDEIRSEQGLLGPISVGDGKTLIDLLAAMVIPDCKVAVLLIPPQLRSQLIQVDWGFYGQHWTLPNLGSGAWFDPKKPTLHVIAYSELSSAKNSDILDRIKPDLIIADEAHLLRNSGTARTKRFKRFFSAHPKTRFCCWSGTLTTKSLKDYAHLSALALKEGSPTPLHWPTVEEWAGAIDPCDYPSGIGALSALCAPGEHVREGFRRRLEDSRGVVASPATMSCTAGLNFYERPATAPGSVQDALTALLGTWTRPDGEELVSALDVHRCAKELSSGFFYHWIWPRAESLEVRERWLRVRRDWHKEMREKLKQSKEFMDSPLLLVKAAIRWHDGFVVVEKKGGHQHSPRCYEAEHWCGSDSDEISTNCNHDCVLNLLCKIPEGEVRHEIPPHTKIAPQPTWDAQLWPEWREVRDTAKPETEGVWIDDFLARDAAAWCREPVGICWYEHDLFGRRVAELADAPLFGPGKESSDALVLERGLRSVVASIRSHGTGKNLQCFSRNLVANTPSDAAVWEQLLGRTHRQGQESDEVSTYVYRHTAVNIEALSRAKMLAMYIQETMGGSQKLLRASYGF